MQFKSFKAYMLVVCSSLVLLGCVSAEKYTKMVNGWIGADEDSLIATWGAPTSSYQTDQAKYLTYDNKQQNYIPPTPSSVQVIRQGDAVFTRPIPGSPGYSYTTECRTTFTVQNKRIVNVNATGNSCVL
jgi:type II secretory pathway pseudopilin PulG